jgi:filamentous hemagglutinin
VTGGLNVLATPGEVAGGSALGGALGGAFGSALDWLSAHGGAIFNSGDNGVSDAQNGSTASGDSSTGPSLPTDLVGEQDSKSGQRGNRNISGPLSPAKGGTGDALQDFDKLTGGQSSPAPADSNYPPGTLIGPNGIAYRPGKNGSGARIDIPANGSKPHETLHY